MASNMSSFFTSLFLLPLIFIQGIIPSIHGRPLNLGKSNELHLNETKIVGNNADIQAEIGTNEESFAIAPLSDGVKTGASPPPPSGHETSDFRPTAPRHSPAIVSHELLSVEARKVRKDVITKTSVDGEVASPGQLQRGIKEELDRFVPAFPPPTPLPNPRVGQFIHN